MKAFPRVARDGGLSLALLQGDEPSSLYHSRLSDLGNQFPLRAEGVLER